MTIATPDIKQLLEEIFIKYGSDLGDTITDEMAFPSYLRGNVFSRYIFWGKLDCVIQTAQLRPDMTVFDFGCGSGILLPTLCNERRTVYATDLQLASAQYLASSLQLTSVKFVSANIWQHAIPNCSLDVIVAANVLEHIDNRASLLDIFASKLKPNGRLVVSGPTESVLYRMGRRIVGFSGEYHVATVYDVLTDIDASGFHRIYRRRWPIPEPFCLYIIAAYTPNLT